MRRFLFALALAPLLACTAADESDAPDEKDEVVPLAQGVHIDRVSLYQTVEVPLMDRGAPGVTAVPVIAGRDALMRLALSFDPGASGQAITGRLWLDDVLAAETTATLDAASSQASLTSTLNLEVPGAELEGQRRWRVEVLAASGEADPSNEAARYAAQDATPLVTSQATPLRVMLLPFAYDFDGSGRLPDLSVEQIEIYRQKLQALYPVSSVEIEIGPEYRVNVELDGYYDDGWDTLLDGLLSYRGTLGVADDVYVYGLVSPAPSFDAYCDGDCTEGISFFNDIPAASLQIGFGLGFPGERSAETTAHEIGHMHGRDHAPCDVFESDPAYPYPDGSIGVWGLDYFKRLVFSPDATSDFMSYCDPQWVSDYTFIGLFERHRDMSARSLGLRPRAVSTHSVWKVRADGTMTPHGSVQMPTPSAPPVSFVGTIDGAQRTLTGHFARYGHGDGGLFIAEPEG